MVTFYYADFSSMDEKELIAAYQNRIDKERLANIMHIRNEKALVCSLIAGFLLQCGVKEELGKKNSKKEIIPLHFAYGKNGKPYLDDYPAIFFNISHSGNVVCCALSDKEIGIDIQKHTEVKTNLAERFFTKEECRQLQEAVHTQGEGSYQELFFRMWSIKESYIKYTGLGMKQGLNTFYIDWEKQEIKEEAESIVRAHFKELTLTELPEYAVSICMKQAEDSIKIIKVKL